MAFEIPGGNAAGRSFSMEVFGSCGYSAGSIGLMCEQITNPERRRSTETEGFIDFISIEGSHPDCRSA
jgi:hypothetical protein